MKLHMSSISAYFLSMVLGSIAIYIVVVVFQDIPLSALSFRNVVPGFDDLTDIRAGVLLLSLLFVNCTILGLCSRHNPLLAGLAAIIVLPVIVLLNVFVFDHGHHNLWPFEVVGYMFLALVPALGSFLGQLYHRTRHKPNPNACEQCGYDLSGTLAASRESSPECGHPVKLTAKEDAKNAVDQ